MLQEKLSPNLSSLKEQRSISHLGYLPTRVWPEPLLILTQEPRPREISSVCCHAVSGREIRTWRIIYQPLKFSLRETFVNSVFISLVVASHVTTSKPKGAGKYNLSPKRRTKNISPVTLMTTKCSLDARMVSRPWVGEGSEMMVYLNSLQFSGHAVISQQCHRHHHHHLSPLLDLGIHFRCQFQW